MNWRNAEQIEKNTKRYTNRHGALRMLLGGVGTGNISMDASGRLCDFELFGHPDKGRVMPESFFALWARPEGEEPDARVLEALPNGERTHALGAPSAVLPGLPRFDSSGFSCRYPFAELELKAEDLPFKVTCEAYTPFIPLDAVASGVPGFQITYRVKNLSGKPAEVSVCATLPNLSGFSSYDGFEHFVQDGEPRNTAMAADGLSGVFMDNPGLGDGHLKYGSLAIATDAGSATVKPQWQLGGWWDGAEEFWQDFRRDGELSPVRDAETVGSRIHSDKHRRRTASVAVKQNIAAGETKEFRFFIAWHFPNRYGWWPDGHRATENKPDEIGAVKNFYATQWKDAWDVCGWFKREENRLKDNSRLFSDALYATTLPPEVIESLVSAITVLRSPTCFRIADGSFYGWEGCFDREGSCPGSCTHVWNYAQALAFLFPELEQSMRRTEFLLETDENGEMAFRAKTHLENKRYDMLPATDGQLGSILRVYREWTLSGDDGFLRELWPNVAKALEFSLLHWDSDGDGILDSQQHNTYDIEFYGVNSLTNSILYAALAACARMAAYLKDPRAGEWGGLLEKASARMDGLLWNGEYYEQRISDEDFARYRYQYGKGCLSDQLLGQQLAHVYGLGYILPKEHVEKAVESIYKYNYKKTLKGHHSVQRAYALQDEGGLLLCSWPRGGRPEQPFVYSDEVWTGIEYQVATHLVYEGMAEEALDIVRSIRERYDGAKRSPYDEIECGHHYARSMAAWGLLVALSGYECNLPEGKVSFSPRIGGSFTCFYSNAREWGVYTREISSTGAVSESTVPLYTA